MADGNITDQPAYRQVAEHIAQEIEAGVLSPASKIPSERVIAHKYGISRMTARGTVNKLVQMGLIVRRKRIGAFVAQPKIRFDLSSRAGLHEQLHKAGIEPSSKLISAKKIPAGKMNPEISEALGLSKKAYIFHLIRLRLADGEAIAVENSYFPGNLFPNLLKYDLTESIYALLEKYFSVKPSRSTQNMEITFLAKQWADIMGVSADIPALEIKRRAVSTDDILFEFAHDIYRGDRLTFTSKTTE
ncbi:MAG: GntR family transcriptional regulator [Sedimentisphaerales bacterium]|nr:GntR family transcriptional regulator [Sedimentisphaerales bacterium]